MSAKQVDILPVLINILLGNLDYKSVADKELKAGASSVASIRRQTGLSPY